MSKLRLRRVLILVVALVLLGALAWGVGWIAHSLVSRPTPPPLAATATATATPALAVATATEVPATSAPAPTPVSPAAVPPTSTPAPTSTPMPTLTPTPTEEWEIVQLGEGLYQVCRRHCPGRWSGSGKPSSLDKYAREVARMNGLRWGWWGPKLHEGQALLMPACPP